MDIISDNDSTIIGLWNGHSIQQPTTAVRKYSKTITLHFYTSEIIYDIRNMAYVEADVMPTDDEHAKHQLADIAEDGNADRLSRVIALAIAECREALFPYTKIEAADNLTKDNKLMSPEAYDIIMKVPDDFSDTTADYLEKLIHELIVYRVLIDWLAITDIANPAAAQNWQAKLQTVKDALASVTMTKMHRARRTLNPF